MSVEIIQGDCRIVLAEMEAESFHAAVTDPPYHLTSIVKRFGAENAAPAKSNGATGVYGRASKGFMGKTWDGGDVAFQPETWAAVYRVLKPGGYLCAFASSRDFDLTASAIRAAGFIMHPFVAWIFATGFPKATNFTTPFDEQLLGFTEEDDPKDWEMSRSHFATFWEGWRYGGQALKPAIEPILMAQKPFAEPTGRENIYRHGTGALNIDAGRINPGEPVPGGGNGKAHNGGRFGARETHGIRPIVESHTKGRWPTNVAHDGSPEVMDAFARFGERPTGIGGGSGMGYCGGNGAADSERGVGDTGTASRFFFCAKADASERVGNHPTVKPVALMEWLVQLVTPPGRVLDPFCGTGSTLVACDRLGFDAVGIEQDAQTVADAHEKIRRMRARRMIGDAERVTVPEGQLGFDL